MVFLLLLACCETQDIRESALAEAQSFARSGVSSVFYMAEENGLSLFSGEGGDSCSHWKHFTQSIGGTHSMYRAKSISLKTNDTQQDLMINDGRF